MMKPFAIRDGHCVEDLCETFLRDHCPSTLTADDRAQIRLCFYAGAEGLMKVVGWLAANQKPPQECERIYETIRQELRTYAQEWRRQQEEARQ